VAATRRNRFSWRAAWRQKNSGITAGVVTSACWRYMLCAAFSGASIRTRAAQLPRDTAFIMRFAIVLLCRRTSTCRIAGASAAWWHNVAHGAAHRLAAARAIASALSGAVNDAYNAVTRDVVVRRDVVTYRKQQRSGALARGAAQRRSNAAAAHAAKRGAAAWRNACLRT